MPMLMFYRLLVMLELLTADFLFMLRLRKHKYFALRFAACVAVSEGLVAALPLYYNAFYSSFTFLLQFIITVPIFKICCDESWKNLFFCAIAAYTMQHIAYGVANFLLTLIQWGSSPILGMYFEGVIKFSDLDRFTLLIALVYIFAYFSMFTSFWFLFVRKIKPHENFRIRNLSVMIIVAAALLVDIFLNAVIVYSAEQTGIVATCMNIVYESLCCGFLLFIQFGQLLTGELANELSVTQYLLRERERQYNISKDNIELINHKCHDLRHQIRSLGEQKGLPADVAEEIGNSVSIYDAAVRTDNKVLDTILTEKSLKCVYEQIELTCIADGRSLEFMTDSDVYSLFGNALDNAMEAVMRLDKSKRTIGLVVRRIGDMISVNVCNPYEGDITLGNDGLPETTKRDRNYHGIGMRSMQKIAEKYNGICSVTLNNNTFVLNILLSAIAGKKTDTASK